MLPISQSNEWIQAYRQFIRQTIDTVAEQSSTLAEEDVERQIDELIDFELKLQNISFAVPLSMELELFNFTFYEPKASWFVQFCIHFRPT